MDGFEYVSSLSVEEKILFVKLIVKLISGDGRIDETERSFIKVLSRQYQIPAQYAEEVYKNTDEDDLIAEATELDSRYKSLFLIKELLTVANTDDELNDREIDLVVRVSEAMGIEDNKVAEINQLVLDRFDWLDRYRAVMELDD